MVPLLDPDIEKCFIGDSDNYHSKFLSDALKHFYTRDTASGIDSDMLVFRPIIYSRKNYNNHCIPNIFAGVFSFKKVIGKVLNHKIWNNIFLFMEKLFAGYSGRTIDNNTMGCDPFVYRNRSTAPFEFGFEEQALSNVLLPNYYKISRKETSIIPICWFHPLEISKYYSINIWKKILDLFSNEFIKHFKELLHMDVDINDPRILSWMFFDNNLHIMTLILNLVKELVTTIPDNSAGTNIKIFKSTKDINDMLKLLGVIPLAVLYPGFEINITKDKYTEVFKELKAGKKLSFDLFLYFSQTHTFKSQVIQLITAYCTFNN